MMVSRTAKSAKKCKMVMLRNGILVICENDMLRNGNSGAENGGSLARHIPNMHTYGSTPPPPPGGGGGAKCVCHFQ